MSDVVSTRVYLRGRLIGEQPLNDASLSLEKLTPDTEYEVSIAHVGTDGMRSSFATIKVTTLPATEDAAPSPNPH
jgi:hypothetical protein